MIAIKDMKMPKNCASCVMRVGKCKERIYMENRPDRCPLTEIKTDGDTISRQAAISIVEFECGEWEGLAQTIVNGIKKLPSVQHEMIGCKDCKHRGEKPIADGRYWCELLGTFMYYCSDAERRTDEGFN